MLTSFVHVCTCTTCCDLQSENELTYVNVEGYMEKLPLNKKKATLLKTWKKRYFKAFNGHLYYYEVRPASL